MSKTTQKYGRQRHPPFVTNAPHQLLPRCCLSSSGSDCWCSCTPLHAPRHDLHLIGNRKRYLFDQQAGHPAMHSMPSGARLSLNQVQRCPRLSTAEPFRGAGTSWLPWKIHTNVLKLSLQITTVHKDAARSTTSSGPVQRNKQPPPDASASRALEGPEPVFELLRVPRQALNRWRLSHGRLVFLVFLAETSETLHSHHVWGIDAIPANSNPT